MRSRPFYLLVTFWGERYREWFCRYALASFLAPGNIAVLQGTDSKFLICTTPADWTALQTHPAFLALKQYVEPVYFESTEVAKVDPSFAKYARMSMGHKKLAERCFADRAYGIFTNVDSIYPDGTIREIVRLAGLGKKVVWCTAVRFDMDGIDAALGARGMLRVGAPIVLSKREAVRLGLANLHRETMAGDWDSPFFGELALQHGRQHFATCCFWRIPREHGLVIITHNWAPVLVDYGSLPKHDATTLDHWAIDGDYVFKNFGKVGDFLHIARDSDELFLLGMTPANEMVPRLDSRWWKRVPIIADWAKRCILNHTVFDRYTDPLRREVYPTLVRWHADDISESWSAIEDGAKRIIDRCMRHDYRGAWRSGSRDIEAFFYPLIYALPQRIPATRHWVVYTLPRHANDFIRGRLSARRLILSLTRPLPQPFDRYARSAISIALGDRDEIWRVRCKLASLRRRK
jgi:hypothetical protein